jgi:cell division protein FtsI (penicillin-binding protein 3)
MTQVIEKSLNTGAIFVQQKIAKLKFKSYLESFGFGARTGVDFPGEVAGDMSNLKHMSNVDFATASFGQGIAATPLQVAMAIGAIANKGTLMQPYIVERVIDSNGAETVTTPQSVREVVNPQTAEDVARMMVSAVDHGFDGRASVKGYFVAAKTGTAQIPREDGRGYSEEFIHTFVGFAPAFEPRFSVLIMMRRPQGVAFASNSLTASFHNLSEFILNYYEIPPDRPITK